MKKFSCGFEVTKEVIGGKWKGLVLYFLMNGPKRTSEIKVHCPKYNSENADSNT